MKKIISALLMVSLMLSMSMLFVSCKDKGDGGNGDGGNGGDGKVNYTVTVVDSDGTAVKGVKVTFITSKMEMPWTTDADGKASYKTADTVKVKVTSVPAGYTYAKLNQEQSFGSDGTLTVTLEKIDLPDWTIRVVDQDGNPIEGVDVQICSNVCLRPQPTDADGYVVYENFEGDFHAMISAIPDGYTEGDGDGYDETQQKPFYNFDSDNLAIITLIKN